MDPYIQQWLDIIENMANENTYKLAWGRALLECVCSIDIVVPYQTFSFEQIATVPVLLGSGIRLFDCFDKKVTLKLVASKQENGLILSHYIKTS